ncbi:MAG: hypothetical protein EP326_09030 [Deltaproteobacteria bacterium]|jgi:hypothetical protein|nr:MAG: hypothetical protein EP326_09030 [Deltaproteobacteria bacterium]TNF27048.1 MAG: hypothetical protein EP319_12400 [Deltaproteobacteria bacterium]
MKLKSLKIVLLCTVFLGTLTFSKPAHAVDPKVKAILTMAAYGTVGGGLLGTASLAFGTGGRSPFIGMSLGLYAGLIFGSYVVVSHKLRQYKEQNPEPQKNYYPDSNSPYEQESSGGGFGSWFGGGDEEDQQSYDEGQRWRPELTLDNLGPNSESNIKLNNWARSVNKHRPVFYMNLMNYQF